MLKIDLVTGFLGSGKTTFIKQYANYFISLGKNVGILENDYGAVNVDTLLLQDLIGDNCDIEMIAGACDADCHRRRFKTKLIAMRMCGFDRIIVEPSGIYDIDEFFDVLREDPLDQWYEIGSVITIVENNKKENFSKETEYLLETQIANAGCVVVSHISETDPESVKETQHFIHQLSPGQIIISKTWDNLDSADFETIANSGYHLADIEKMNAVYENDFETLYFLNPVLTHEDAESVISKIFQDTGCGNVCRLKGFISKNSHWIEINATKSCLNTKSASNGQSVIIIIGENLDKQRIADYLGSEAL